MPATRRETSQENALAAMPLKEQLTSLYQLGISTERPPNEDFPVISMTQPEGQTVAEHCSDQSGY
jgi:hypothetical protein